MSRSRYEVRVVGRLGPAGRDLFSDLGQDAEPAATVLSGDLDQQSLHALLDRIRRFGLELIDVRRLPPAGGK